MFDPVGLVSITLGSVVLDRPDQTGRYFAKDMAGGWAYLIGDAEGDSRGRGQGVCEGGLDLTLRCGFLSAASRVPRCSQIKVLVETQQAHRIMVELARKDPHVIAAIRGRPVSVMTRPDTRSSFQARAAAERAAAAALRNREHAEWASSAMPGLSEVEDTHIGETIPALDSRDPGGLRHWRAHPAVSSPVAPVSISRPALPTPSAAVRWLVNPILQGARDGLTAAGVIAPRPATQNRAVRQWLQELDIHVASVRGDLQDAGA